ncbi:MAG: hypothetical protein WCG31_05170 [Deltaproteobacteria bacterium]|jgi:hypothetical protein
MVASCPQPATQPETGVTLYVISLFATFGSLFLEGYHPYPLHEKQEKGRSPMATPLLTGT